MRVKTIVDEDFVNYKKPAMFIGTISCGGKCCIEAGIPLSVCQNDGWRSCAPIDMSDDEIICRYINNSITKSIVFGGLEPFEQWDELLSFIHTLRHKYKCYDDVVIYTGYNKEEIENRIVSLSALCNIVIKFGRYVPDTDTRFDDILGVTLASENQYAERIGYYNENYL